jgi:hypothetical protein
VSITDQGGGPISPPEPPDLAAKVSGQQRPRGWGFFLIEKMVDDVQISGDGAHHTIELFLYLEVPPSPPKGGIQSTEKPGF